MKRTALILVFAFGIFLTKSYAQPSFYLSSFSGEQNANVVVLPGQQICKPVRVFDFTELLAIDMSLNWDPNILQFESIQNIHPDVVNLNMGDFDVSAALVNNGQMSMSWVSSDILPCDASNPGPPFITLDDEEILYEICFTAQGQYAEMSPVTFSDVPVERYVTRLNANCIDIGEVNTDCSVSVGVSPLIFNISSGSGQVGDQVCVDLTVEEFSEIVSMQFSMKWDCDVLEFASAETNNLPTWNVNQQVNVNAADCFLSASWFNTAGISLDDGTAILTLCFNLIGEGGESSTISVCDMPTDLEVINDFCATQGNGCDIQELVNDGTIVIENFNPNAISISMDDETVCQGESFCVDLTVEDFDQILQLGFTAAWNPSVLQLTDVTNIPTGAGNFPNTFVYPGQFFDNSQLNQGKLGVNWEANSITLDVDFPDGTVIMSLCFTVVGDGGSNSIVSITDDPDLQEIIVRDKFNPTSENIGINADNAVITVKPSEGITVSSSSTSGFPGQNVCIDVSVINFENIERMAFTTNWNDVGGTVLEFSNVQNFGLPDLGMLNFTTTNSGNIGVEWETFSDPVTVPDGTTIFQVCFDIIGDPGDCTEVNFSGEPFEIDIVSSDSGGANIGITAIAGEVCVENPLEVELNPTDEFGTPNDVVCVQFPAINFTQLTGTQFMINFDETVVEFLEVNGNPAITSFDNTSFDASNADSGEIGITWETSALNGVSINDGDSFFEVCFTIIGGSGDCSSIVLSGEQPFFIDVTSAPSGNANLGLISAPGSVCVSAVPEVTGCTSTFVDCPGDNTGTIELTIEGGSGNYTYNWVGPNVNNVNDPSLMNLVDGIYFVTITDMAGGGQTTSSCEVGVSPDAPFADAGIDMTLGCGDVGINLNGSNSTQSTEVEYMWVSLGQGLVPPGEEIKLNPDVIGNDEYELTVTNFVTGCVVKDTVEIFNNVTPSVMGGPDTTLTCFADTVQLDGSESTNSNGFTVEWTAGMGGVIMPGTENSVTPVVQAAGEYYIQVTHNGSGCFERDTVIVIEDMDPPMIDIGMPDALGCNDISVILDASNSEQDATFEWSAVIPNGNVCSVDPTQTMVEACASGEYSLVVTSLLNGCTAEELVMVESDTLKPNANAGLDTTLTCIADMITLDGSASSQGDSISYQWTLVNDPVSNEVTFDITEPGVYELTVMNENNGCSAVSSVEVLIDQEDPVVMDAGAVFGELTCDQTFDTLYAIGDGGNLEYSWLSEDMMDSFEGDSVQVMAGGTYSLTITDADNGCTAETIVPLSVNTDTLEITAGVDKFINCISDTAILNGEVLDPNANFITQWSTIPGCITNSTELEPTATCAGNYLMIVQNLDNGCLSQDMVVVDEDMTQPELLNPMGGTFTCETTDGVDLSVELNGSDINDVTITWTLDGDIISGADGLMITATETGNYEVMVVNNNSQCDATETIIPDENIQLPTADAGMDDETTCDNPMVGIDASSSLIPDVTTVQWWEAGANPAMIGMVNETNLMVDAGIYFIIVEDTTNGCVAIDTVMIETNADFPMVNAGMDANLGCTTNSVMITGTGSADDPISFEWFNGMTSLGTSETIEFTEEGTYILQVTNDATGCSAEDEITIGFEIDGPPADAMSDSDDCSTIGVLIGNLPEGATGTWSAQTSGIIDDTNADLANVSNLQVGSNSFTWTLSLGSCENYSSSTTVIETSFAALNANIDIIPELPAGTVRIEENVLNNDITGGADVSFAIAGTPTAGTIDSINADGMIFWTLPEGFFGEAEVEYEICSELCPVCDTAFLRVVIPREANGTIPNGITPNGDGLNDTFIFDELVFDPEKFPENELIIFNRWGDEVYQAKPYLNEWGGTNQDGKSLPDGTYYYILRLDIGQSEIIRGDVTILK